MAHTHTFTVNIPDSWSIIWNRSSGISEGNMLTVAIASILLTAPQWRNDIAELVSEVVEAAKSMGALTDVERRSHACLVIAEGVKSILYDSPSLNGWNKYLSLLKVSGQRKIFYRDVATVLLDSICPYAFGI